MTDVERAAEFEAWCRTDEGQRFITWNDRVWTARMEDEYRIWLAGYRAGAQSEQAECVRVVEDTVLQAVKRIEEAEQRVVGEIMAMLDKQRAGWAPGSLGRALYDTLIESLGRGEYKRAAGEGK